MPRPELIIFDCDGVLVDSEPLSLATLGELITASGVEMQPETVQARFQGRSLASTVQELQAQYQIVISEKDLAEMNTRLFACFKTSLEPIPGVREFINRLTLPFVWPPQDHLNAFVTALVLPDYWVILANGFSHQPWSRWASPHPIFFSMPQKSWE